LDVGLREGKRILDGIVHMRFRGKVDYRFKVLIFKKFLQHRKIIDVPFDKAIVWSRFTIL
jgi:hypothetical protein